MALSSTRVAIGTPERTIDLPSVVQKPSLREAPLLFFFVAFSSFGSALGLFLSLDALGCALLQHLEGGLAILGLVILVAHRVLTPTRPCARPR